jgi:serine/threonine protein kinase
MVKLFATVGVKMTEFPAELTISTPKLGSGNFGAVYSGTWQDEAGPEEPVAVKLLSPKGKTTEALQKAVQLEVDALEKVAECDFVLHAKRAFDCKKEELPFEIQTSEFDSMGPEDTIVGLVTNLATAGKLETGMMDMTETERYSVTEDYAMALRCLAGLGLVHRDIKTENLMLEWRDTFVPEPEHVDQQPINDQDPIIDVVPPINQENQQPMPPRERRGVVIDFGLMTTLDQAILDCQNAKSMGTPAYRPIEVAPVEKELFGKKEPGTNCEGGVRFWDGYGLGMVFQQLGGREGAGPEALSAATMLMNVADGANTPDRWDEFISKFDAGRRATAESVDSDWQLMAASMASLKQASVGGVPIAMKKMEKNKKKGGGSLGGNVKAKKGGSFG